MINISNKEGLKIEEAIEEINGNGDEMEINYEVNQLANGFDAFGDFNESGI